MVCMLSEITIKEVVLQSPNYGNSKCTCAIHVYYWTSQKVQLSLATGIIKGLVLMISDKSFEVSQ